MFEKLEVEARKIDGVDTQENLEKLQPIIEEIDAHISEILGIEKEFVENLRTIVKSLAERRVSRTMRARPEVIKGEEKEPKIRPPKKSKRKRENDPSVPLDRFIS